MNKTVLITGATSGLGYDFVKLFAADQYNLVLAARNGDKLHEIQQQYPQLKVTVIRKDLSIPGAAKEVFDELQAKGITVDVLVNNAGFGLMGKFDELSITKQTEMIQVNITALTELTHYFLPQMKLRRSGQIMNVASTAAFQPGPLMAVYYATKAFVLSFSEALVEELKGTGVTVTTLCPGPTRTKFGETASVENTKMFSRAMDSAAVAKQGYKALLRGQRVVVTGSLNKAGTIAAKFLPRSLSAKAAKYIAGEK
ncbi:SDR family NAD(P)-dependent oxidoreductase [Paenibacillus pinistramenti]|uniref:SDR family NAD(P)-dependent oxidoreductase n=1 Tax=Paenibacillus pinistramenti TaxID=1768003 RepID=UPI00110926E1|nr:SDR family oxidoreductase [Paenibacillus pinistramenti]